MLLGACKGGRACRQSLSNSVYSLNCSSSIRLTHNFCNQSVNLVKGASGHEQMEGPGGLDGASQTLVPWNK